MYSLRDRFTGGALQLIACLLLLQKVSAAAHGHLAGKSLLDLGDENWQLGRAGGHICEA